MSNSRSSTVSGLSGRLQGLKFMQRANAQQQASEQHAESSTARALPSSPHLPSSPTQIHPSQPGSSVQSTASAVIAQPPTLVASQARRGKDPSQEDEAWSIPGHSPQTIATSDPTRRLSSIRLEHEPAWSAWLADVASSQQRRGAHEFEDAKSSAPIHSNAQLSARRSFGAWAQKKRAKSRTEGGSDDNDDISDESENEEDDDDDTGRAKPKSRVQGYGNERGRRAQGKTRRLSNRMQDEEELDEEEVEGLAIIDELRGESNGRRAPESIHRHSVKKRKHSDGRAEKRAGQSEAARKFKKPGKSPW